jgi:hypothetical protein
LISADVVLAEGRLVTASEQEHPDLFWALRGGGGNFGVVTSFLFRLHPVDTVFAGPTFWPLEQTGEVMTAYRDFILNAPKTVGGFLALMTIPPVPMFPVNLHLRKVCAIMWCCTGPVDKAEMATKPMRSVGKPLLEHLGEMPFPAVQSIFDPLLPPGLQWYWRADFVNELSDQAIARHIEYLNKVPTALLSRCKLGGSHRGRRFRSRRQGCDLGMVQGVLRRAASVLRRRRVREFHDGGGPGARAGVLPRQLRAFSAHQEGVRPGQLLSGESKYSTGVMFQSGSVRIGRPLMRGKTARCQ